MLPVCTRTRHADDLHDLTRTEWLLTNGMGMFAMGTASGIPTRRYHGLLVASLRPPVNRVMTLAQLAETVVLGPPPQAPEQRRDLYSFRFQPDCLSSDGVARLERFERDVSARWTYRVDIGGTSDERRATSEEKEPPSLVTRRSSLVPLSITKTVHIVRDRPEVLIRYDVRNPATSAVELHIRPLIAMRDFHSLQSRHFTGDKYRVSVNKNIIAIRAANIGTLTLSAGDAPWTPTVAGEDWWHNFQYDTERDRGYDHLEDLFIPGLWRITCPPGQYSATIRAALGKDETTAFSDTTIEREESREAARLEAITAATRVTLGPTYSPRGDRARDPIVTRLPELVRAADDFVIKRVRPGALPGAPADRVSIIAGYPWFADWGRDSMISLPGLLLTTGRLSEARAVLATFAAACKDGLIPNVFDDYTGQAHYNTVDASLWFVHAACRYLDESGDEEAFTRDLLPACEEIVRAYESGTHFGIRMDDADGLINAGDESTQLTWMDAKRDGVVFTPRHGKAVEINALWNHALRALADAVRGARPGLSRHCADLADKVARSFRAKFWNEHRQCLHDTLGVNDAPCADLRPNQVFAVSLDHSPLTQQQQRAVVRAVTQSLFTPHGMRTLDRADWRYKGRFRGRMFDRDAAYHNGTAWPWLLGPLAEATCRAEDFSPASLADARRVLDGLLSSLDADCCGQIAEVYDGDDTPEEPQHSGGCPAQAWSVAELLRVQVLIARAGAIHGSNTAVLA